MWTSLVPGFSCSPEASSSFTCWADKCLIPFQCFRATCFHVLPPWWGRKEHCPLLSPAPQTSVWKIKQHSLGSGVKCASEGPLSSLPSSMLPLSSSSVVWHAEKRQLTSCSRCRDSWGGRRARGRWSNWWWLLATASMMTPWPLLHMQPFLLGHKQKVCDKPAGLWCKRTRTWEFFHESSSQQLRDG